MSKQTIFKVITQNTAFLPLVFFSILVWFLFDGLGRDTRQLPSPLIGKNFPNLTVVDFQTGEKYPIQDKLKNQISLVNIWASWCLTCRAEHQVLDNLAKTSNLQIIGINYKDTKKEAARFLDILGNPFDFIVFDQQGKLGLELGVYATPETFITDQNGVIHFKHIGEITQYIWQNEVKPLIKQLKN